MSKVNLGAGAVPKPSKFDLRGAYSAASEDIEEGGAGISKKTARKLISERMRGGGMVKKRKR